MINFTDVADVAQGEIWF